jgi:hypothetical protein
MAVCAGHRIMHQERETDVPRSLAQSANRVQRTLLPVYRQMSTASMEVLTLSQQMRAVLPASKEEGQTPSWSRISCARRGPSARKAPLSPLKGPRGAEDLRSGHTTRRTAGAVA